MISMQRPHPLPVAIAKCARKLLRRQFIPRPDTRNKLHLHQKTSRETSIFLLRNQQHASISLCRSHRKQQPSIRPQSIQPDSQWLRRPGIYIQHIARRQRPFSSRPRMQYDLRKFSQIFPRTLRKLRFNLISVHRSPLAHQLRQHSCVITGSSSNVNHSFTLPNRKRSKTSSMQTRLPIVDRPAIAERDHNILIQKRRIIRHDVASPWSRQLPGRWPHKLFSRRRRQRSRKLASRSNTGIRRNQIGEESSAFLNPVHLHTRCGDVRPGILYAKRITPQPNRSPRDHIYARRHPQETAQ